MTLLAFHDAGISRLQHDFVRGHLVIEFSGMHEMVGGRSQRMLEELVRAEFDEVVNLHILAREEPDYVYRGTLSLRTRHLLLCGDGTVAVPPRGDAELNLQMMPGPSEVLLRGHLQSIALAGPPEDDAIPTSSAARGDGVLETFTWRPDNSRLSLTLRVGEDVREVCELTAGSFRLDFDSTGAGQLVVPVAGGGEMTIAVAERSARDSGRSG